MAFVKVTDFLTIDPTTIVLTLCNTLILFLILKHFLFEKVNKVMDDRKSDIEGSYQRADEAEQKANQLAAEYTEKISNAKEESAEIVKAATQKAQLRSDEIIADAKNEAKGIIDNANAEIEREKKIAVNQIKDEIADIALSAASAVVEKEISGEDNERLIESFIDSVGEV
ncbi:MAG: F0F1 ATP synthase subunit B [Oscillospiraceae bacterium]